MKKKGKVERMLEDPKNKPLMRELSLLHFSTEMSNYPANRMSSSSKDPKTKE